MWYLPLPQVGGRVDVIGITAEDLAAAGELVLQVKELAGKRAGHGADADVLGPEAKRVAQDLCLSPQNLELAVLTHRYLAGACRDFGLDCSASRPAHPDTDRRLGHPQHLHRAVLRPVS